MNLYRQERFRVTMKLRCNNVRVLLHRPILVKFLDACSQSDIENQEGALLQEIGYSSLLPAYRPPWISSPWSILLSTLPVFEDAFLDLTGHACITVRKTSHFSTLRTSAV